MALLDELKQEARENIFSVAKAPPKTRDQLQREKPQGNQLALMSQCGDTIEILRTVNLFAAVQMETPSWNPSWIEWLRFIALSESHAAELLKSCERSEELQDPDPRSDR